ncbi:CbiQ family ECF transporter T component [Pedococcus sp. 5OH_020]|uniref:CbiQ family ECF transporter T component n=1 Tax=Pedococcus sp. 5OH_020 TaxID=2989814 RepID=UPI0022E9E1F7|nr:CbiQ family ECF transporter T component [Pedococcus sp. 5OH_020]
MRLAGSVLPRDLHPVGWWAWAIGMAVAASRTTNPLLLLLTVSVTGMVVVAKRGSSPWARAFRLYLALGSAVVLMRVVLHVLVGQKAGTIRLLALPGVHLPGITLLGPLYLEGLLAAAAEGLRLATLIVCIGAANALANPKRLLRTLPSALHEIGTAVVISVSVAPQLAESVLRVRRARALRGEQGGGLRTVGRIALPVLQDTLDRSLLLASAMDSRGYGRRAAQRPATRRLTAFLTLTGLLGAALGLYAVLDQTSTGIAGWPLLAAGLVLCALGLHVGGRGVHRTVYRPDAWAGPEWAVAGSGVAAGTLMVVLAAHQPTSISLPLEPLGWPALPWPGVLALAVGAAPALLAPPPPVARRGAAA